MEAESGVLQVKLNMNTPVEEVLAFKTCCGLQVFDQNLEILVTNRGSRAVVLIPAFDLVLRSETRRYRNLLPAEEQSIEPGEVKAFYCQMDEQVWKRARELVLQDTDGHTYRVGVADPS